MAPAQDSAVPVSRIRRAQVSRLEQEEQLNVLTRKLADVCGRLGAIPYPAQIHGHAIKTVADAVCDLEDIRASLPNLLGTPSA